MKNNSHQKAAALALVFLDMNSNDSHLKYLCHCLRRVSGPAARNLEKEIEKRLWPNFSLDGWLAMHGEYPRGEELQQYRERWLLKLAKELDNANTH